MNSPVADDVLSSRIKAAQQGSTEAMAALYDTFATDIFRYGLTLTKDKDIAEDIASETFLRAWIHLPAFQGDTANFRAYLYTIARNYAYDIIRKESHTTQLTEAHEPLLANEDILQKAVLSEQQRSILGVFSKLSGIQQEVVILRFFEGLSVKETAKIIGCSEANVRVVQCRALRKLQQVLS